MRVLWVAGEDPNPVRTGLHAYSGGLASALAAAGASVEAIAMAQPGKPATTSERAGVTWRTAPAVQRGGARSAASVLPNATFARASAAMRALLDDALARGGWDAVVLDHIQAGWALPAAQRSGATLVHVSHNHEASVRAAVARTATGSALRRLALRADARKAARLERRLVAVADVVTAITGEDAAAFRAQRPGARPVVLTPGYAGPRRHHRTIDGSVPRRVVLVGSLDWHVKQANLQAFLDVADPAFARAGIELVVAGPAPRSFVDRLRPDLRATQLVGRVDDLPALLATARVGVVSERDGGGFKLKSLDYVFGRVPMAVLAGSLAGLPLSAGRDYLSFEDNAALAAGIVAAVDDLPFLDTLQDRAFRRCSAAFDWRGRGMDLAMAIDAATSARSDRIVRA